MKVLAIDIETTPNLAHVWGLWQQNVGLPQLLESTEMMCFAAKWLGDPKVRFHSTFHDGKEPMVRAAHTLLDEADAVLHFNGKSFDVPHLNREFVEAGIRPPSPYKQIDLMLAAKKAFRFPSNKLQYISTQLGLEGKVQHAGHALWIACMNGDPKAWAQMRKYNRQDVVLLEQLHEKLLPWVDNYPNVALHHDDRGACTRCGSHSVQRRGTVKTAVSTYPRFQCQDCGGWFRGTARETGATSVAVAA